MKAGVTDRCSPAQDAELLAPSGGQPYRAAEFFAGIGLVRLALEAAGIQVAFANDISPQKQALYVANFGGDDFHLGDIHALAPSAVPDCDLFTASFPCTDLSIAGARNGLNSGQSSAFWGFLELVRARAQRPRLILLENVTGFLTSHGGRDFEQALTALNELGYAVDAVVLDAVNFVPQSRPRLFVVGLLGAPASVAAAFDSDGSKIEGNPLRPRKLLDFIAGHPGLKWNLAPLEPPTPSGVRIEAVVESLPDDDPAWWNAERTEYFMNQLSPRHAQAAALMIAGDRVRYATAFRRVRKGRSMAELRIDGIAGCLRTPRGGSGRQILFQAGCGRRQVRLLTARECARLQGAPDTYRIDVPLNQALFGFGDAVCVPAVTWLAQRRLVPFLRGETAEAAASAAASPSARTLFPLAGGEPRKSASAASSGAASTSRRASAAAHRAPAALAAAPPADRRLFDD